MNKIVLDKYEVQNLVMENRYSVNPKTRFLSRCIDGRYENKKSLEALTIPGADGGELALLVATANEYGFTIDLKKTYQALMELVGGEKNIRFHTDFHAEKNTIAGGCGHMTQIRTDLQAYKIQEKQLKEIVQILSKAKKAGAEETVLKGEHLEGALLLIKGEYGIYPQYQLETEGRPIPVQVFIYHQTLVDERHRLLSQKLIEHKVVELFEGCNAEYLYAVLSDMAERHLFETSKRLAKGLPIFDVLFSKDGSFKLEERGVV